MRILGKMTLLLVIYSVSFVLIEWAGVFAGQASSLRGVLTRGFVLILLLATGAFLVVTTLKNRRWPGPVRGLLAAAVILVVGGLWISRFYDFRIDVVITEGQVYRTDGYRSDGLLYAGLRSAVPAFALELREADEVSDPERPEKREITAQFFFTPAGATAPVQFTLRNGLPRFEKGMFMDVEEDGFSTRYALTRAGRVLESTFVSLRIHPPGNEDYFRLMSPHTVYLQYHPGHREGEAERPIKLRVARNKDLMFNGFVGLREPIELEDARLSIEEVRRWVRISIGKYWGILTSLVGAGLGVVAALLAMLVRPREER